MKKYDASDIKKQFAELEEKTLAAARQSLSAPTLNKRPALISFDESETDLLSYLAIRNASPIVLLTVSGSPEAANQQMQHAVEDVDNSFKQRLRAKMEVLK